ncbi:unnamed protein product [Caenorhabditis nigoni]
MSLKFLISIILICILIDVVGPHPVGFHNLKNPFTHPLRCAENSNSTSSNCLISNSENAKNFIIIFLPFLFSILYF